MSIFHCPAVNLHEVEQYLKITFVSITSEVGSFFLIDSIDSSISIPKNAGDLEAVSDKDPNLDTKQML